MYIDKAKIVNFTIWRALWKKKLPCEPWHSLSTRNWRKLSIEPGLKQTHGSCNQYKKWRQNQSRRPWTTHWQFPWDQWCRSQKGGRPHPRFLRACHGDIVGNSLGRGDPVPFLNKLDKMCESIEAPENKKNRQLSWQHCKNKWVAKFPDFSVLQILREINFEDSRSAKSTILTHIRALNCINVNFRILKFSRLDFT